MIPLLLALAASAPAHALTVQQSGPYVEAGVGLGLGDAPLQPGLGWNLGAGWWSGRYDDAYAIGRYWGGGLTVRQDWVEDAVRTAPMLEIRRGTDLVFVGWHVLLASGPLVVTSGAGTRVVGGTARAGVGVELRRTPHLGITLRLEGGADIGEGRVAATGAALLGFQFSRPRAAREDA